MRVEDWDRIDIFLKSHPCTVSRDLDVNNLGSEAKDGREKPSVSEHYAQLAEFSFTFFTSKKESASIIKTLKYEADMLSMGIVVESLEPPPGSFEDIYTFYATFYEFLAYGACCDSDKKECCICPMLEVGKCSR